MKNYERWLLAVGIIAADFLIFVIPLTAFIAAYILIQRPTGFKTWIDKIYSS